MKNLFTTSLISLLAIGSLLVPMSASAATGSGTASLHFSPASGSYTVGQTFSMTITETSSVPVAAVELDVAYPSALLQCNGPASLGAFATSYHNSCAGGSLSLGVGVQGTPVSGTQTVGSVSFTVLASGNAGLTVADASEIDDTNVANACDTTCASGVTAASYSLAATPVQPTQPSKTSGSSSSSSNSGSKATTSGSSTTSTTTNNGSKPTTTTSSNKNDNKNQQQNDKHNAPQPKHINSRHTGLVQSTLTALLVLVLGVYWLVIRKRPVPVKAYRLNAATSKSKPAAKKEAAARSTATAVATRKAPVKKATVTRKPTTKKIITKKKA